MSFDMRHGAIGFRICPTVFGSYFGSVFLTMPPMLPFVMAMHILYHCVMEVCNLFFDFKFTVGYRYKIVLSLRKDFGL